MKCPCNVDHWFHVASGFQGIVSMMYNLNVAGIVASDQAMTKLAAELKRLTEQIEIAKAKRDANMERRA